MSEISNFFNKIPKKETGNPRKPKNVITVVGEIKMGSFINDI